MASPLKPANKQQMYYFSDDDDFATLSTKSNSPRLKGGETSSQSLSPQAWVSVKRRDSKDTQSQGESEEAISSSYSLQEGNTHGPLEGTSDCTPVSPTSSCSTKSLDEEPEQEEEKEDPARVACTSESEDTMSFRSMIKNESDDSPVSMTSQCSTQSLEDEQDPEQENDGSCEISHAPTPAGSTIQSINAKTPAVRGKSSGQQSPSLRSPLPVHRLPPSRSPSPSDIVKQEPVVPSINAAPSRLSPTKMEGRPSSSRMAAEATLSTARVKQKPVVPSTHAAPSKIPLIKMEGRPSSSRMAVEATLSRAHVKQKPVVPSTHATPSKIPLIKMEGRPSSSRMTAEATSSTRRVKQKPVVPSIYATPSTLPLIKKERRPLSRLKTEPSSSTAQIKQTPSPPQIDAERRQAASELWELANSFAWAKCRAKCRARCRSTFGTATAKECGNWWNGEDKKCRAGHPSAPSSIDRGLELLDTPVLTGEWFWKHYFVRCKHLNKTKNSATPERCRKVSSFETDPCGRILVRCCGTHGRRVELYEDHPVAVAFEALRKKHREVAKLACITSTKAKLKQKQNAPSLQYTSAPAPALTTITTLATRRL